MAEKNTLDISWGSIIKVFLSVIIFYLLYQVMDVLVWFIFALIISILFNPVVDFLKKLKVPRVVGVIVVYFTFFGLMALFIGVITPGLYNEIKRLSLLLPGYIEQIAPFLQYVGMERFVTMEELVEALKESSEEVGKGIMSALAVVFGGVFATFFIITMAIFLSLEGNSVEKAIKFLAPEEQKDNILFVWKKCRNQVSSWFLVRILSCLFVGVASFLVFYIFEINYAIVFAIAGGLLNFIPFIGSIIAGLIFFVITALDSVTQAIFVLVAHTIIQAIDGNIVTPVLSKKIMGVSSVLVLIALVVGGMLWGALGAFLAIPLLGIIFEFFKLFLEKQREKK